MAQENPRRGGKPKREIPYDQLSATLTIGLKTKIKGYGSKHGDISAFVEEAIVRELERRKSDAQSDEERLAVAAIADEVHKSDVIVVGQRGEEFVSKAINYAYHYFRLYSYRLELSRRLKDEEAREEAGREYLKARDESEDFLKVFCSFEMQNIMELQNSAISAGEEEARQIYSRIFKMAREGKIIRSNDGQSGSSPNYSHFFTISGVLHILRYYLSRYPFFAGILFGISGLAIAMNIIIQVILAFR